MVTDQGFDQSLRLLGQPPQALRLAAAHRILQPILILPLAGAYLSAVAT